MDATASSAVQSPTQELLDWIVDGARAGQTPEQLLDAMTRVGWPEETAIEAMEQALRTAMAPRDAAAMPAAANAIQPPVAAPVARPVPEPSLDGFPLYLNAGDRRVHVLQVVANPRVVVFGDFLSGAECDEMIALAAARLKPSKTVDPSGGEMDHPHRTSSGMFFKRGESDFIKKIEDRIATLVNWPAENGEAMQVLRYLPGAEYRPHYDYFDESLPSSAPILARGGQRVATFLMYLGEPEAGGGTLFPDVGLEVAPKRGNALFFSYSVADPSSRSLHGGQPVVAGEKWVATKWLRAGRFS